MRWPRVVSLGGVLLCLWFMAWPSGLSALGPGDQHGLDRARGFHKYTLFYLGASYAGDPLTAVLAGLTVPVYKPVTRHLGRATSPTFTFVYGTCDASAGGCSPPYEIENYQACARNLHSYPKGSDKRRTVRGVPAAVFGLGDSGPGDSIDHLELYTGDTTVVIDASSLKDALSIAMALRSINGRVGPYQPLARPRPRSAAGPPALSIASSPRAAAPVRSRRQAPIAVVMSRR